MIEPEDKAGFTIAITAMLETYGQEATKARLMGYWYGLRDLPLDDVRRAVGDAMRAMKRLPVPAELRELIEGSDKDRAINAWGDVIRAVPVGSYQHVDFEDGVINATIRNLGGWPLFLSRLSSADSEKWARIEFLRCYESMARSCGVELCAPLAGLSEGQVINGRVRQPVPRRIRCHTKASGVANIEGKNGHGQVIGIEFNKP